MNYNFPQIHFFLHFKTLDTDKSGTIELEEFMSIMEDRAVISGMYP